MFIYFFENKNFDPQSCLGGHGLYGPLLSTPLQHTVDIQYLLKDVKCVRPKYSEKEKIQLPFYLYLEIGLKKL